MKTFFNFVLGKDYLNSAWTAQLHETRRLHVIYLAVDPKFQHHGLAEMMMNEVIACADRNDMMISLETHNPKNIPFYEHLGFKTFGIVGETSFSVKTILYDQRIVNVLYTCSAVSARFLLAFSFFIASSNVTTPRRIGKMHQCHVHYIFWHLFRLRLQMQVPACRISLQVQPLQPELFPIAV